MPSKAQTVLLAGYAVLFWALATAWIRLAPSSVADPLRGDLGDEHVLRLGAAWLLWGYGVTLLLAFAMQRRATAALSASA